MGILSRKRFLAGVASTTVSASSTFPAFAADFDWKWGSELSADHPIPVRAVEAFAQIRNDTSGQLNIRAFPNSVLGGQTAMLAQLRSGALEMLTFAGGLLDTVVPVASIELVAFAFPSRPSVFAAMDGDLGALIRREIMARDIMVLDRVWDNGWRDFTTNARPLRSVGDLQGLNVRVSVGKLKVDTIHSLGAVAVALNSNEMYTALQTHIVDAQESPIVAVESFRLFEVQKYYSITHHQWGGFWTLINMDKWKSLSSAFQRIVQTRIQEATMLQRRDTELLSASLQDKLERQGLVFNRAARDSFKEKLIANGYYERWKTEFGDRAWAALERYTGRLG